MDVRVAAVFAVFLAISDVAHSACTQNDVRLQAGPTKRQGRVEICRNNQWGTVCHDWWGTNDAKVVCNQLNYDSSGAIARYGGYFPKGWGKPIWLDNVRCGSKELTLVSCPRNCIGCHNCNHHKDAGAECPPCLDGNMWLPGGSTWREGTVEICYGGVWSTVCDDQFGLPEAKVVCTFLGYDPSGAQSFGGAYFGERYGPIVLDQVGCSGTEKNLFDCPANSIGVHDCDHSEDAGVRCPVCPQGSIRLWSAKNDTPAGEGMLHYCHQSGEWKAMCRYLWDCRDAKVACRDLGYNGSLTIKALYDVDGAYGFYLPVLPQRVGCTGNEAVLKDCNFYYTTWCDHALYETAGVRCTEDIVGHDCTNGDARLVNGNSPDEGRLEYCFHDEWSPFCWMHDEEASVACKHLGYTEYTIASLFIDERFGTAGYTSDFNSLTCSETASENKLSECDIKYSTQCTVQSCTTEFGIKCFNPGMCTEGDVRLVNGNIEQEGRAEVCYKGVWTTICDWGWNALDAYVFCRTLGYDSSKSPDVLLDSYFGDGSYPVAIASVACGGWEKNILDCKRREYLEFYTCGRHSLSSVRCYEDCKEGDVRLVDGPYDNEGTVEICVNGLWGLISDAGWDDNDAKVICRQAGFPNTNEAVSVLNSRYSRPNKTVHYANVHCTGNEDKLDDCTKQVIPLSDGRVSYLNATVVGVDCVYEPPTHPPCIDVNITALPMDSCTEGTVRLTGGDGDGDEGRAEYCIDGRWSPFCIMDDITASVICKTLSFTDYSWATVRMDNTYGVLVNYSHFDNFTCDSSASQLSDCTLNMGDCIPYCPNKNVALRCFTPLTPPCDEGAVRLVDGFVDNEGRVEVCLNGVWGGVCDDGWDLTDSHVVCSQLGHPELLPVAFHNSYFDDGIYPIVYSNLKCGGYEKTLGECDKNAYGNFTCSRDQLAGVLCGQDCENGDLRLMGGSRESEGTVEICMDNVWGNILETGFGDTDAGLVCKLLGFFQDGATIRVGSYFGKTGAAIHVTDLLCTGDELSILECSMTINSLSTGKDLLGKDSSQVVGLTCLTEDSCIPPPGAGSECSPGDIQIDNVDSSSEGNLIYCTNGTWSPFCSLNGATASVICNSLGYNDYTWAGLIDDGRYNPTSNVSLFQNFTCTGEESALSDCTSNSACQSTCKVPYGIQCYNPGQCNQESMRLANGDIAQEGRVEVCLDNVWGAVCGVDWEKIDAHVICRQLGFGDGEPMIYTDTSEFGETPGPIVYSDVNCQGYEKSLLDCQKSTYFDVSCPRTRMAGVVCTDVCTDGDIKLMGSENSNEGTVVICKDGFWGVISQTTWDDRDAQVVCRQLGYPTDGSYAQLNSRYGKPNITLQSSSVVCEGSEEFLTDCKITWVPYKDGKAAARHVDVGGVYCPPPTPPPECETAPPFVEECSTGDVRFGPGSQKDRGLLQYCYNKQWTYFCSLDPSAASRACYDLGYQQYSWASIITDGVYGDGDKYSFIDMVTCDDDAKSLADCSLNVNVGCLPKCSSNVAVRCYDSVECNEGELRLTDGGFAQRGRIEQCLNGVWGSVCDSGWDNTDVYTLCKGFGYDGSKSIAYTGSVFGAGSGPAIYSNFACDGAKTNLLDCAKDTYPNVNCTLDQLAGALCTSDCNDGDVRLVGGANNQEGTVEICFNGIWGLIFDLNWGTSDALVVCRQLNLPTDDYAAILSSHFGRPNDAVHLSNVGCFGDELSLSSCIFDRINIDDSQLYQAVAGVTCRARYFNKTTTVPPSVSAPTLLPTGDASTGSKDNSRQVVQNVAIIMGVVCLIGIAGAIVIFVGLLLMRQKRDKKTKNLSTNTRERTFATPPVNQVEKDVVNPLAVEAGLEGDDDENTKTLQDLIHESQMK